MNKKLGPLKLWQWAALGAALGLIIYLYEKHESSSATTAADTAADATTPADDANDDTGSWDGSGDGGGSSGSSSSGTSALGTVEDWQALETALSSAGYSTLQIDPQSVTANDPTGLTYAEEYEFANGGLTQANSDIGTIQGDFNTAAGLASQSITSEGTLAGAVNSLGTGLSALGAGIGSQPAPVVNITEAAQNAAIPVATPVAPQQAGAAIAGSNHSASDAAQISAKAVSVPGASTIVKNGKTTVRSAPNNEGGFRS